MFFVNLKAHYEELSVYEQEVIDYLMKQDNIEAQTLKSIGAALHLSASTIVRAGKKLGYATFNELKYDLRRSKESNQESHHLEASHFDLMKAQLTDEFQRTMALLDQADFESVADRVLAARRVFCVGLGLAICPCLTLTVSSSSLMSGPMTSSNSIVLNAFLILRPKKMSS